jgi:hypothetical protein
MVIDLRPLQPEKASASITVKNSGKTRDVRLLQSKKAPLPILVTELGMVIDVR